MLAGVARYFDGAGTWVVPVGITGTETLFPIGEDTLHPVRAVTRIGRPIRASALRERSGRDRGLMMDGVGLAIAEVLPAAYRGVYADTASDLDAARRVLGECRQDGK